MKKRVPEAEVVVEEGDGDRQDDQVGEQQEQHEQVPVEAVQGGLWNGGRFGGNVQLEDCFGGGEEGLVEMVGVFEWWEWSRRLGSVSGGMVVEGCW